MNVVLPAIGHLCGSTFVNKAFIEWLKDEHFPTRPEAENFNVTWASLGFSNGEDFLTRCSASFDDAKAAFSKSARYDVQVYGKATFRSQWHVEVPK